MNNNRRGIKYFIIAGTIAIIVLLIMMPGLLRSAGSGAENGTGSDQLNAAEMSDDNARSEGDAYSGDESGQSGQEADAEGEGSGEKPSAVVFCASDYQAEEGWDAPAENLTAVLGAASEGVRENIDMFIMCGDYTNDPVLHDYQLSPEDSIAEIRGIVKDKAPGVTDENMIFVQGNHDALTDSIAESGLHEYDDYLVYVLNTQNDFPWKQGKTPGALDKVKAASKALDKCLTGLAEKGEKRPVIIAGHVPLHFTARTSTRHTTGDNLYSSLIFNVVNKAGKDLDIIYLYGHNHSKGWDCYMGGSSVFRAAGDTVLIPELSETVVTSDKYTRETLAFTYMNAGYTGYFMNCGPEELDNGTWKDYDAADTALTGTVIGIYDDRIEISRWDSEGMHPVSSQGEGNPYKGGIDAGIINESDYGTETDSPVVITRRTRP